MLRTYLVLLCLAVTSCTSIAPQPTHDHRFTIPFSSAVDLTIWEPQERSVDLHLGVPKALLAPGDVQVMDVWRDEVVLTDADQEVVMVMDGIDVLDVDPGDVLCGGTLMGNTKQVRIRAYWGLDEADQVADLSLVRVVRNSMVTDLSDVRVADQVHSALALPGKQELRSDINRGNCPYGGE